MHRSEDATLCMFGDGATNQGTFGETMNLAALWKLPLVFMVINNEFGMGTALERHSAVPDLSSKPRASACRARGATAWTCSTCTRTDLGGAGEGTHRPRAPARRGGHLPLPRPLDGRPRAVPHKDEVEEWRPHDPIETFPRRLVEEGVLDEEQVKQMDDAAMKSVDEAVEFADASPFPDLASLYDDVYVIGEQVRRPYWSTDVRSPDTHRGEEEREAGEVARELAEAGAAYDDDTDPDQREARARGEGG